MLKLNQITRLALILPCLLLCSCMQTPQEKLVGRWFNGSNSIRFSAEGHVRWNSQRGTAQGAYSYDGSARRTVSNEPVQNLRIDMVRGEQSLQSDFELEFLGNDRVRLTPMAAASPEQPDRRPILILKRAGEDDVETQIPLLSPGADTNSDERAVSVDAPSN